MFTSGNHVPALTFRRLISDRSVSDRSLSEQCPHPGSETDWSKARAAARRAERAFATAPIVLVCDTVMAASATFGICCWGHTERYRVPIGPRAKTEEMVLPSWEVPVGVHKIVTTQLPDDFLRLA